MVWHRHMADFIEPYQPFRTLRFLDSGLLIPQFSKCSYRARAFGLSTEVPGHVAASPTSTLLRPSTAAGSRTLCMTLPGSIFLLTPNLLFLPLSPVSLTISPPPTFSLHLHLSSVSPTPHLDSLLSLQMALGAVSLTECEEFLEMTFL